MSLSASRSRRSNAGNRWAEALAAALLENENAPDPEAEVSGEEFIGKEEDDIFESDFESTDEEEYAREGVQDEEKQVVMEERAERRAARTKASKSAAVPVQRMLERATKGASMKKNTKVNTKKDSKAAIATSAQWDATRQSRRTATVKHKKLVRERLKDAEERRAHTAKRPRKAAVSKTQAELIAEALELEEKNTKSLKEFLVKEEEKRAAARRVVRTKVEAPLVRWVSRAEDVRVKVVDGKPGAMTVTQTSSGASTSTIMPNGSPAPATNGTSYLQRPSPLSQFVALPPPVPDQDTNSRPTPIPAPEPGPSQPQRASGTPAPSASGQRMQMYVEIPRRSVSSSQRPPTSSSSQPLPSISISQAAPTPPARSSSLSRSVSGQPTKSTSPVDMLIPNRPNMIRQASVSSTSSSRSRMMMYVELPAPGGKGRGASAVPEATSTSTTTVLPRAQTVVPSPRVRNMDNDIFPPGGPNFAIVLPQRKSWMTPHRKERQAKNYVVVELTGRERNSFGARMRAVFGDHANWREIRANGTKPALGTPMCPITGLPALYRDSRTGVPYANAYAYKTLTRLLQHEFVWSQEGHYVGDDGRNAARGVPWNWVVAATGRS